MRLIEIKRLLPLVLFVLVFFVTRVPRIYDDNINPDGYNWHERSQQFIVGLKSRDFLKTYQHYHPGVTLMWLTGVPIEVVKKVFNVEIYDEFNFQLFDVAARLTLVTVQLFLTIFLIFLLTKLLDFKKAFIIVGLFTFEPFFTGNSRLYHMDVLFTLFSIISVVLICLSLAMLTQKTWYAVLAGFFCALTFLTRSIGVGVFLFAGLVFAVEFFRFPAQRTTIFKNFSLLTVSFVVSTILLFPALWVAPVTTIMDIFSEGRRIGIKNGHSQVVMGEVTERAGSEFYPLVLLIKVSPVIWVGFGLYIFNLYISLRKKQLLFTRLDALIFIFYLTYFLVMSLPSKKIDRYMVAMFPALAYYAFLGYARFYTNKNVKDLVVPLLVFFWAIPYVLLFPHYFIYTSPLFASAANANKFVGQKPFGVGVFDLKDYLIMLPGSKGLPTFGFNDPKPMMAIYPNSRLFDLEDAKSTSYEYAVLGVNEIFPPKALENDDEFEKIHAIYLGGLEYWRIYEKRPR